MKGPWYEVIVDLQLATEPKTEIPNFAYIEKCVRCALVGANYSDNAEVTVRVVDKAEIQQLNGDYRHQNKPTNILSFPFKAPENMDISLLGDLVICAEIVDEEAKQQHKTTQAHWTHMIIHGILHLLGYDHINGDDAEKMEAMEIELLMSMGLDNPYLITDKGNS